ncbi:MAG: DUF4349 domain-containing protein [Anaerolineae bacterium]
MDAPRKVAPFSLLMILVLLIAACAPAATPAPQALSDAGAGAASSFAATLAPAPTQPPGVEVASADRSPLGDVNPSPYRANRLIIKNGEMNLMVADTDRAIDQVTDIAVNGGGYIVSSRMWAQDEFKFATLTMGVPVDQFEAAQRQLRALAVTVLSDTASGQDVSEEFVDLQSRLTNLEATAARIREFLNQATTVDEALQVNARLTEVENEIEQIKGRMNYLKDRAAFSTIVVNLEPQRPTPTPTPTATPVAWMPEKTFNEAAGTLSTILRSIGDLVIWFGVVIAPFVVPLAIVGAIWARGRRKQTP